MAAPYEKSSTPEGKPPYDEFIDLVKASGKRLVERAGKIQDIGITKTDLTEEDLRIERDLADLISKLGPSHALFAEEEHTVSSDKDNVWVVDPISGTATFLRGDPHYAIVVAHTYKGVAQFAAIYDPSVDELFTAERGKGARLNSALIQIRKPETATIPSVILRNAKSWEKTDAIEKLREMLSEFKVVAQNGSMAVSYASVARGECDAVISLSKDSFPEVAGSLLVQEAGGMFTNVEGSPNIRPEDKVFIGGSPELYARLLPLVQEAISI